MNKQQIKRIEDIATKTFLARKKDILKNLDEMEKNIYRTNEELRLKGVPLAERKSLVNTARQKKIDTEKIRIASMDLCMVYLHEVIFNYWETLDELDTLELKIQNIIWYRFDEYAF
jgi:hypothetical protein